VPFPPIAEPSARQSTADSPILSSVRLGREEKTGTRLPLETMKKSQLLRDLAVLFIGVSLGALAGAVAVAVAAYRTGVPPLPHIPEGVILAGALYFIYLAEIFANYFMCGVGAVVLAHALFASVRAGNSPPTYLPSLLTGLAVFAALWFRWGEPTEMYFLLFGDIAFIKPFLASAGGLLAYHAVYLPLLHRNRKSSSDTTFQTGA
jgi:hypothetical protein